jgi:hypothetical protein
MTSGGKVCKEEGWASTDHRINCRFRTANMLLHFAVI